jgi:hypothetical protein
MDSGTTLELDAVWGSSANDVYVSGGATGTPEQGIVLHRP